MTDMAASVATGVLTVHAGRPVEDCRPAAGQAGLDDRRRSRRRSVRRRSPRWNSSRTPSCRWARRCRSRRHILLGAGGIGARAIHDRVRHNLGALRAVADRVSVVRGAADEGGWSAVVRVPATRDEEQLVLDLLAQERVLVHPGYFFDFPREA